MSSIIFLPKFDLAAWPSPTSLINTALNKATDLKNTAVNKAADLKNTYPLNQTNLKVAAAAMVTLVGIAATYMMHSSNMTALPESTSVACFSSKTQLPEGVGCGTFQPAHVLHTPDDVHADAILKTENAMNFEKDGHFFNAALIYDRIHEAKAYEMYKKCATSNCNLINNFHLHREAMEKVKSLSKDLGFEEEVSDIQKQFNEIHKENVKELTQMAYTSKIPDMRRQAANENWALGNKEIAVRLYTKCAKEDVKSCQNFLEDLARYEPNTSPYLPLHDKCPSLDPRPMLGR